METLRLLNYIISILFTICYLYQFIYIPISWFVKKKEELITKNNRYAILICARNEEAVIGDLLNSINNQTYPNDLIDTYVMADNCYDHTALIASKLNAKVYERFNKDLVGKGYALNELIHNIWKDNNTDYDGYFVFDADNILKNDYIEKMNNSFNEGYDIISSYRNSKNYEDNWISAGYALWFLRESRYLHMSRHLLNISTNVSGTGFVFSKKVAKENDGWPFHLLTEDIEFSIDSICKGYKIAFNKEAELFDEQPTSFIASINQRLRWAKGYFQVIDKYGIKLLKNTLHGDFSSYDMLMNNIPALFLSILSVSINFTISIISAIKGNDISIALISFMEMIRNSYLLLLALGAITTFTEWKHIYASAYKKIVYIFTFPLFMFTYVPISIAAIFLKVTWKPIIHNVSLNDIRKRGLYDVTVCK